MNNGFFEAPQKRFFVFSQVKSIVKTSALRRLRLHASAISGPGHCLGIAHGQQFPMQYYYLRGLDDLLLKEGGVVKRTLAQSSGRKEVNLNADANSMDFPSRHARVAFLLNVLKSMPEQPDPYRMSLDRSMLDHLRDNVEGDPEAAKKELLDSVVKIQKVYWNRTIRREIRATQQLLAADPCKVSYQKSVLKLLLQDFQFRRSWLVRLQHTRDSLLMHWT